MPFTICVDFRTFSVSVWVSSGFPGFLQPPKNILGGKPVILNHLQGVNVCVRCVSCTMEGKTGNRFKLFPGIQRFRIHHNLDQDNEFMKVQKKEGRT